MRHCCQFARPAWAAGRVGTALRLSANARPQAAFFDLTAAPADNCAVCLPRPRLDASQRTLAVLPDLSKYLIRGINWNISELFGDSLAYVPPDGRDGSAITYGLKKSTRAADLSIGRAKTTRDRRPPETAPVRKVLVVDDEPKHRELLSRRLRAKGFEVATAEDGDTALQMVARERPDIILMDIKMPGRNGWETTRALKSSAETRTIPVIAVSAFDLPNERQRCAEAGCDEFEAKPLALESLLSKIDRLCPAHPVSTPQDS